MATLHEFEELLRIDCNALDTQVSEQPDVYYRVSQEASCVRDIHETAKLNLDAKSSQIANTFRGECAKSATKITEGAVGEHVTLHPEYKALQQLVLETKHNLDKWQNLLTAYQQRSQMLKLMADLYVTGYWTRSAVRSKTVNQVKDDAAHEGRVAMSSVRTPLIK